MKAEIITIGDELLIGQVIDSNSAFIGRELNKIGVQVHQISSLSDDRSHILKGLSEARDRADIIIITGGLGPTKDDITKKTLAEFFNVGFRLDEQALENVKDIFQKFNRKLLDVNIKQAEVPENCIVLQNKNGTAPGMYFNEQGKHFFSLPGVPFEMMALITEEVIPILNQLPNRPNIVHKTMLTAGIGESYIAEKIKDLEDSLPKEIKLAYLPKLGQVRLRLTGIAHGNVEALNQQMEEQYQAILNRVREHVIVAQDLPIEKVVMNALALNKKTLATAESCTGGYIAHLLTAHPGSSKSFIGGAVAYSYALKEIMLGVKEETLANFGAVSEEVVKEMCAGIFEQYDSDYAIACSGIAGPDGGTPEKPVGTVWIAIGSKNKIIAKKYFFSNKRLQNIERTAIKSFEMLLKLMEEEGLHLY